MGRNCLLVPTFHWYIRWRLETDHCFHPTFYCVRECLSVPRFKLMPSATNSTDKCCYIWNYAVMKTAQLNGICHWYILILAIFVLNWNTLHQHNGSCGKASQTYKVIDFGRLLLYIYSLVFIVTCYGNPTQSFLSDWYCNKNTDSIDLTHHVTNIWNIIFP